MNPHLAEDTDDENCDDPIRLFDNDLRAAVYFGSKPLGHSTCKDTESRWLLEAIGNVEFCHSRENYTLENPDGDQVEKIQSGITSECDITPLSVKLVDCGKFPWYFKKYSQQIMHKINLNQHSDSDDDVDVEIVDDSDDCFIIEDLQDIITNKIIKNDQLCIKTVKFPEPRPKIHKNKMRGPLKIIKRRRDDDEIRKALSVKHSVQVDLKRNQGLIGMKIVQKVETNETLDIIANRENLVEKAEEKKQSIIANEKYVSAADKALNHIGTQLIPIIEEKESNSICQLPVIDDENDLDGKPTSVKSPSSQNITVQFDISKISDKLIDNLKAKKTNDLSSDSKVISQTNKSLLKNSENKIETENNKELSSKETVPEKIENSSTKVTSHVKNVKNTNKYKNDQNKINSISGHSSLVGLLVTNKGNEDIKEMKCKKQKRDKDGTQSKNTKVVKKPLKKKVKKQKPELKSPILHCSTMIKKAKYEMPPKCDKSDTNSNLSKELSKLTKMVDKLTNIKSCNSVQDTNRPKPIIFPRVTQKPFDVHTKQAIRRNINPKSLNVSHKLSKNCNDVQKIDPKVNYFRNTQTMTGGQNKALNEQNVLGETRQNNMDKHTKTTIAVTNPTLKEPIKNNKPTVCNSNVPTTTVAAPASGLESVSSIQHSNFPISHGSHFPIDNVVHNKMSNGNIPQKHVNVPVQNRYASAIILKSNNHTIYPFEKHCESPVQTVAPQRPIPVLTRSQPQCRDPPPPYPTFYPPAPSVTHGYFPSSKKILKKNSVSKQFHSPQGQLGQQPVNSAPKQFHSSQGHLGQQPINSVPKQFHSSQGHLGQQPINSVPKQFHSPQGNLGQQPNNPMQDFYRQCWLPQNMAPPPPPPPIIPPPPPPIIPPLLPPIIPPLYVPPRNSQSNDCVNLNGPSASVVQNPQSGSLQNTVNTLQTNNSSIIGVNNDGLVKKINIAAMPVQNNVNNNKTIKVEQVKDIQIMNPVEDTAVVNTKKEMLKELDKLSFVDGNNFKEMYPASIINDNKKENTLDVAIMSNKPGRFETLKLTMNSKDKPVQTPIKGYSPPILPIPTYQKVLRRVNVNPLTKITRPKIDPRPGNSRANTNESKPMRIRDFVKCCKRKFNNAWNNDEDCRKKEEAKKISLEEYKKRLMKNFTKSENNKNLLKNRKNFDYSTETDLGYDSDSTVVL